MNYKKIWFIGLLIIIAFLAVLVVISSEKGNVIQNRAVWTAGTCFAVYLTPALFIFRRRRIP